LKHEPEKAAVAYLSGTMRSRRRARFEQHIVDCEDCWQEVQLGRTGRSLAESGRELAPQDTRENIRAVIAAHPGSNKSWRVGWGMTMLVAAAAVIASAGYLSLRGPAQPPVIEAVLTDYREPARSSHVTEAELPRRLGDLRYLTSYVSTVDDLKVIAHAYRDPAGHKVIVYQADSTFPVADGAEHSSDGRTWSAATDGVILFCADDPIPSLVVGDDLREVTLAARELGLR